MSIIIGVAAADGLAVDFLGLSGIGDVVVGEGDGTIVIPGIGAIVGWGEGWASTICGAIQKTRAAETFIIERQLTKGSSFFRISYAW